MKTWQLCHRIKILEALGCIADKRMDLISETEAKTYSSKKDKFYTTIFDPKTNTIYTNDNMSFYVEKLGYPNIAFLCLIEKIKYDKKISEGLKGIIWKDLNKSHKNNWDEAEKEVLEILERKGIERIRIISEMNDITDQLKKLELKCPEKMSPPPKSN